MSISGIWTASVTPLRADLSIDTTLFASHVQWLLERGNDGVAVFGSTGEANSFTVAERIEAVDAVLAAGVDPARIIVGAGACAFPDGITIAAHATRMGAAGVLVTPPFYYKGVSDDGIFSFFERLVEGVGANLKLILYHFPRLVAIGFSEELIGRLVDRWPRTIVALKDSSGDLGRMKRVAEAHPSVAVLAGTESLLLDLLDAGGAGCLTASANLTSVLAAEVYRSRSAELQERLTRARAAVESAPFVPGIKQIMAEHTGLDAWLNVRPPLEALSGVEAAAFRVRVREFGTVPNLG